MNILALDLGTKCGWAISDKRSGVWKLAPSRFESAGQRFIKFKVELQMAIELNRISFVAYEEVRAHIAVDAAHVYGGLVAVLQTVCLENGIEYAGVPVGTIKKHATGNGAAKKDQMILAAQKFYPSVNILDDNHADALCLLHYAQTNRG